MVKLIRYPLKSYIERESPYAFVRYGDGEWLSILRMGKGHNCDSHPYSIALSIALQESLKIKDDNYIYAMGPLLLENNLREPTTRYLLQNDLNMSYHNADVFVKASRNGNLYPMIKHIRDNKVLYVCPEFLHNFVVDKLDVDKTVVVPERNAFESMPDLYNRIKSQTDLVKPTMICFSAGFVTKVLIAKLWKDYDITMIDFGSLWDCYVGKNSRSYMRGITSDTINKNLGQ